ncbi:MAG: PilZ domain-containing protein [Planctomycetales bacterium]
MIDRRQPPPRRNRERRDTDRRLEPRLPSAAQIRFLRAGTESDEALPGELAEVSSCGLRLVLDEPLSPGERMLVEVRDRDGGCFNLSAAVVWTDARAGGRWLVGCALSVELSDRRYALLSELVRNGAQARDR